MVNGIPTTTVNITTSDTMTRTGQNYKINKRIWELIEEQTNNHDIEEILADFNARLDAIEPCDDDALAAMLDEIEANSGLTKELVAEVLEEMLEEPSLSMTYEGEHLLINDLKHTGNITIDWGNGAIEEISDENQSAFEHTYEDGLESHIIKINGNVTNIGVSCFYDCTGLTSVTIPDSVTSLGVSCFSDCTGLTSVTIPDSVTSLGNSCFYGCTGLTSVTIPDSVTSLGDYCFSDCTGLTSIQLNWTTTSTILPYSTLTQGLSSDFKIHIPSGTTDLYTAKGYPSDKFIETEAVSL